MTTFINIADLRDSDDPEGRTFRQINMARTHKIPVGALVEIVQMPEDDVVDDDIGVRLYVAAHHRDCDGTPLYAMLPRKAQDDDDVYEYPRGVKLWRPNVVHGYPEDSLKVIKLPE